MLIADMRELFRMGSCLLLNPTLTIQTVRIEMGLVLWAGYLIHIRGQLDSTQKPNHPY